MACRHCLAPQEKMPTPWLWPGFPSDPSISGRKSAGHTPSSPPSCEEGLPVTWPNCGFLPTWLIVCRYVPFFRLLLYHSLTRRLWQSSHIASRGFKGLCVWSAALNVLPKEKILDDGAPFLNPIVYNLSTEYKRRQLHSM